MTTTGGPTTATTTTPAASACAAISTDEHEDPSLSSASLCIQFHMLGETFRPVFTHQAFPGETIRGYHPPLTTLMECTAKVQAEMAVKNKNAKNNNNNNEIDDGNNNNINNSDSNPNAVLLHSSHIHHEAATKELAIDITLSPSCQICQVEITTEQKRLPRRQALRTSKRRRLESDGGDDDDGDNHHHPKKCSRTDRKVDNHRDRHKAMPTTTTTRRSSRAAAAAVVEADSPLDPADEDSHKNEEEEDDEVDEEEEEESDHSSSSSDPEYDDEDDDNDDNDSEFQVDDDDDGGSDLENVKEQQDKEGATRMSRMPAEDILESLKKGLPTLEESSSKSKNKVVEGSFLRWPLGLELQEYSVNGQDFILSLASGAEARKYHTEVQRLALWFIETADDVDVASQEGGFWKVLYLFQKHKRTQYSLAGYVTLFHFHAPFKKPKPGMVVRICQVLVLPPYQRAGHGKRLMMCVMDIAHNKYSDQMQLLVTGKRKTTAAAATQHAHHDDIVEINVESPAPGCVMLRNRTDYECFLQSLESEDPWIPPPSLMVANPTTTTLTTTTNITDPDFFSTLPESCITEAASKAKITPRQIQVVLEIYKLGQLQEHLQQSSSNIANNNKNSERETLEKRFRLMVKKRLNKEHREILSGLRSKADKQAFLEEEYNNCFKSYQITLSRTTSSRVP